MDWLGPISKSKSLKAGAWNLLALPFMLYVIWKCSPAPTVVLLALAVNETSCAKPFPPANKIRRATAKCRLYFIKYFMVTNPYQPCGLLQLLLFSCACLFHRC